MKYPLALFGVARLLLSTLGFILWAFDLVPPPIGPRPYYQIQDVTGFPAEPLLGIWQRYDGVHYIRIALEGYSEINLTVFFPLYPVLIRLAMPLAGGNALLAALVLSNAACLLALVAFYKLLEFERFDDATAQRAVMYCLFFPAGVFLFMPYTESLFLLLAVLCMLTARQGQWGWAALAALAASLTRVQGVALAALLGAEALQQAGWSLRRAAPRLWVALAPLLGAGSFLLWRSWASWPPMNEVLGEIWGRFLGPPGQGLLMATQQILSGRAAPTDYVEYPITWMMLAAAVPILRRLPLSYGVYFGAMLLMTLSQYVAVNPLLGQARYALIAFPIFMVLADRWPSPWFHRLAIAAFVAVWAYYACVVVLWGFVG